MDRRAGHLLLVARTCDESEPIPALLAEDYDLTVVCEGSDALRRLGKSSEIELVLVDGSPPDMPNLQLVRGIRERHAGERLPLIMLAGAAGPEEVAEAFAQGADNCLTAPPVKSLLKARVDALLEQKRSYERAEAKSAELQANDMQHLQILRMAAHDLQSPLGNILLAENMLRRSLPVERPEVLQSLNMIRAMAENIGDTLGDYLKLLEVQSGRLPYRSQPVNLRDAILNAATQFESAAGRKGIRLNVLRAEGWVLADAERVVQALANLVSNAIKYSPYDSEVTISTTPEAGFERITVADEGPGIPVDDRPKLFREFSKASTQPTGNESRTGLGLWIVKQLVEAQGGRVGADFPAGGGSRFWTLLPVAGGDD